MIKTKKSGYSRGERTYQTAVSEGNYNSYIANLWGKFHNTRLYWEDQVTRFALLGPVSEMVDRRKKMASTLRILDLGCGSGQGFDNLTRMERDHLSLQEYHDWLVDEDDLYYFGVDLSPAMIEQGKKNYADRSNVRFDLADLNEGLGPIQKEDPFDIYYSSYGSLSHLERSNLVTLLTDVANHGKNGSLVVLDLLGRYSLEWPCYWNAETEKEKFAPYTMSYLYLGNPEAMSQAEHFPIRYWGGEEIPQLVTEINSKSKRGRFQVDVQVDRSILMGRHSDTQEFNPDIPPVRSGINKLLEDHMRTNLLDLMIDPMIVPEGSKFTEFYRQYIDCWNTLIKFTQRRVENALRLTEVKGWSKFPAPLQFALMSIDRVINDVNWMGFGDPRANILEPQLAYTFQSLERNLQKGLGCGHGLLVVLRLEK